MKLLLFLIPALLWAPEIPIHRNQSWNKMVINLQVLYDNLDSVQIFLKKNETQVQLDKIDVRVIDNLDKAISASKKLNKDLKDLRSKLIP